MTLRLIHLTSKDYREMPWKNGGGSTTEIAIYPETASLNEPFLWRLSLAQLKESGPFSSFPGYDRSIVQLSGKPMTLKHDGHADKRLEPLVPYPFDGEWKTESVLSERAEDFNLMTLSTAFEARLDRFDLALDKELKKESQDHTIIWVFDGEVEWKTSADKKILNTGDTLILEMARGLIYTLEAKSEQAIVFVAKLKVKGKPSVKAKDPLAGVTLEKLLTELVNHYGWEYLGEKIPVNCFLKDPSIKSSLTFLRKTPWARTKVEKLYIGYLEKK
ncbi:MAG: DNA-binding protein VF530 [Proteobacteria bacterium]|nr:MAG: DNA-binding protein VF530 [Pseudomonadota bacterium]